MNSENARQKTGAALYVLAAAGTFLIMAFVVWLVHSETAPAPLEQQRGEERLKILADYRAANEPLVSQYDWQDQSKGLVRVPIQRAMELVLQEWQDPAAGRSNLLARAAKAFAPPPKLPEAKNPFE